MKRIAVIAVLLLTAGCAAGSGAPIGDATTHIVITAEGDRIEVLVDGTHRGGFQYRAIIRPGRPLDAAARRGILNDAMPSVMLIACGAANPYKLGISQFETDAAALSGRFTCAGK